MKGQWAPIAGTGLAIIGSLYILLAQRVGKDKGDGANTPKDGNSDDAHNACTHGCHCSRPSSDQPAEPRVSPAGDLRIITSMQTPDSARTNSDGLRSPDVELASTSAATELVDQGHRVKVGRFLMRIGDYLSTSDYYVSDFKRGPAVDYPERKNHSAIR